MHVFLQPFTAELAVLRTTLETTTENANGKEARKNRHPTGWRRRKTKYMVEENPLLCTFHFSVLALLRFSNLTTEKSRKFMKKQKKSPGMTEERK